MHTQWMIMPQSEIRVWFGHGDTCEPSTLDAHTRIDNSNKLGFSLVEQPQDVCKP